jgi:sporulation protein YlmC with PRC-barrel domain
MNNHPSFHLRVATLVVALASLPALAQTSTVSPASTSEQEATATTSTTGAGEASKDELRVSQEEAKQEVTDINKASKVIGMAVKNKENEDLGKVHDLVIDPQSGKIVYAVLSSGGILGMGDRLIAVPFESLTPQQGEKGFLLDADKERLSQAPGITEDNWPRIDAARESTVGLSPTGRPSTQSGRADFGDTSATSTISKPEVSDTSSSATPATTTEAEQRRPADLIEAPSSSAPPHGEVTNAPESPASNSTGETTTQP